MYRPIIKNWISMLVLNYFLCIYSGKKHYFFQNNNQWDRFYCYLSKRILLPSSKTAKRLSANSGIVYM